VTVAAGSEPWQAWMRRLQGIADTGLAYARDQYDVERYLAVRAVAAELGAHVGGGDAHQLAARLAADGKGHPTPKVDVRAAAFRDGRVLLVLERSDGGWTLPGGWADIGEPPAAAALRELREESGWDARAAKLFAVHDRDRHNFPPHPQHIYKLFFLCELTADAPTGRPDNEVDDVQFFARDALPEQLSTGRTTQSQLEAAFAHHDDPSLPTEFD
jgi:ADP-ribose pyrophosphatase YjhB (NUDIX family)